MFEDMRNNVVASVFAMIIGAGFANAIPVVTNYINRKKIDKARADGAEMLEEEVFRFDPHVSYLHGTIHPNDFRRVPDSMEKALSGLLKRAGVDGKTEGVDGFIWSRELPRGNIVTVGSPNSNEIACTVFENQLVGGSSEYINRVVDPIIPMDVRFVLDKATLGEERVMRGSAYDEPNWKVSVKDKILKIKLDTQNRLMNDYLVITKTPNVFDPQWASTSNSIFTISGIHGPGTQAFALVLENHRAISKIKKLIKAHSATPYWQIVVPVIEIDFDNKTGKDFAKKIDVDGIQYLPIDITDKISQKIESYDWIEHYYQIKAECNRRTAVSE